MRRKYGREAARSITTQVSVDGVRNSPPNRGKSSARLLTVEGQARLVHRSKSQLCCITSSGWAWASPSFPEKICQEGVHPPARIISCLGIVLGPMPEHHSPGLKDFNIEGVVSARIGDELDERSRISPVGHRPLAIAGGRPII